MNFLVMFTNFGRIDWVILNQSSEHSSIIFMCDLKHSALKWSSKFTKNAASTVVHSACRNCNTRVRSAGSMYQMAAKTKTMMDRPATPHTNPISISSSQSPSRRNRFRPILFRQPVGPDWWQKTMSYNLVYDWLMFWIITYSFETKVTLITVIEYTFLGEGE